LSHEEKIDCPVIITVLSDSAIQLKKNNKFVIFIDDEDLFFEFNNKNEAFLSIKVLIGSVKISYSDE
jgi:predicted AAA+ superfamily ATPase